MRRGLRNASATTARKTVRTIHRNADRWSAVSPVADRLRSRTIEQPHIGVSVLNCASPPALCLFEPKIAYRYRPKSS